MDGWISVLDVDKIAVTAEGIKEGYIPQRMRLEST